jgi:hypothetical protein
MKKFFFLILIVGCVLQIQAQGLDRITISSGAALTPQVQATIGQVFNFCLTGGGYILQTGAQSDTSKIDDQPVGIVTHNKPSTQHSVVLYPNPVRDEINLKFVGVSEISISISIFDINGNIALSKDIMNNETVIKFDVHKLAAGAYLLNSQTSNGTTFNSISFIKTN